MRFTVPELVKNSKFNVGNAIENAKPVTDTKHPEAEAAKTKKRQEIDYKALNYTELIPILIKGVQEQQWCLHQPQLKAL